VGPPLEAIEAKLERRDQSGTLPGTGARRFGGGYARGVAGDEPPEMVAPHFLTARAASHVGHY
jgi:hypothetical protein